MKKKILSILLSVVLILMITVSSIPFASAAVKAPSIPKSVKYISDYIVREHCLEFKGSKGGATGYHVQIINASGKVTSNQYYKSTNKKSDKTFFNTGDHYIVWCNNNFNKYIARGQFYKIRVRAFNVAKPSSYKTGKKPSGAKYSGYSATYGAESVKGAKAVKTSDKKGIKISWSKTKGANKYYLRIIDKDGKYIGKSYILTGTSKVFTKVNGVSFKGAQKISVNISPIKVVDGKNYNATAYGHNNGLINLNVK